MDIKRAKQEIKDSIEAYLAKDEFGDYRIPAIRLSLHDALPIYLSGGHSGNRKNTDYGTDCERMPYRAGSIHDHTSYKTECGRAAVYSGKRVRWENGICNRVHDE